MDATVNKNILSFHLIDKIAGCDRMNKHFVTTRCFLLPVSFAKLFPGDSFDPFPVPDDVEEQAEHHDVPLYVCMLVTIPLKRVRCQLPYSGGDESRE